MFNQNTILLNVYQIPSVNFENLCTCVYCWNFQKTRKCVRCKKIFCKNHREAHLCFKKSEIWN